MKDFNTLPVDGVGTRCGWRSSRAAVQNLEERAQPGPATTTPARWESRVPNRLHTTGYDKDLSLVSDQTQQRTA